MNAPNKLSQKFLATFNIILMLSVILAACAPSLPGTADAKPSTPPGNSSNAPGNSGGDSSGSGGTTGSVAFTGDTGGSTSGGQGNFPGADEKFDYAAEYYKVSSSGGQLITQVMIKAGTAWHVYTKDANDGCYAVSGLGSATIEVQRVGSGSGCKQISHIEILYAATGSTPTPTTSSTPSDKKVTICHATSSATNPYVIITVSINAAFKNQGGHFFENGTTQAGHEDDFVIGAAPAEYPSVPTGTLEQCGIPAGAPTNTAVGPTQTPALTITPGGPTVTPTPTSMPISPSDKKVTICHATSSATNPYVIITVSINAAFKNQGGHFFENGTTQAGHEDDFVIGAAPAEFPSVPTGTLEQCGIPTATPTNTAVGPTQTPALTNTPGGPTVTPTPTGTPITPTAVPTNTPDPLPTPPVLNITRQDVPQTCVQYIIFHTFRDGNLEIYRLDGVEGESDAVLYNLSRGSASEDSRPSRSWDDRLIVFNSNRDGNLELYLTDAVGSYQERLTFSGSNNINAMFLPDNQTVVFQSDRNGNWDLFSINILTGVERQLTTNSADDVFPFASPSSEWISFQSSRSGNADIYLLNLLTGDEFQVTRDNSDEIHPTWSPNGQYLAYLTNQAGLWDLIVMDVDARDTMNLTPGGNADANNPSWSPEGNRIAYQSERNGKLDVYTFDLITFTEYKVSDSDTNESSPTWDCGGSQVSFTSLRDGNPNIYAAPWTGGSNGYLTNSPATDKWSEWSPAKEHGSRGR